MDGLVLVHKPIGLSSAQTLYRVRRITGQRKSGHAGTLDPLAAGVLVLCLGRATKLVEALMDQPKVYRTAARLDVTSESYDTDRPLQPVPVESPPNRARLDAALARFVGEIDQVPPAVSAVKVGGRPAYRLARAGAPPKLAARPVRIYWLHVHRYAWPELDLELACGRGTYVRSLIRDVGVALGTGGCLTSLVRVAVGPFTLADCHAPEQLENAAGPDEYLVPLEEARSLLARRPVSIPPPPASGDVR